MELTITGLRKFFPRSDGEPTFEMTIPSLSVRLGTLVYVLGRNGSGKTVFLKTLCGDMASSSGELELSSPSAGVHSLIRKFPLVRQRAEDNLALELSVMENIVLHLPLGSMFDRVKPARRMLNAASAILNDYSELTGKANQPVNNLSVGQRQMLAFACATVRLSTVLCLDEFLASADPHTSKLLRQKARKYALGTPACVFVVSHDIHQALEDADRILILRSGRVQRDLQPSCELWNQSALIELLRDA